MRMLQKGKEKYIRQMSNETIIVVLLTDKINLNTKTNIRGKESNCIMIREKKSVKCKYFKLILLIM